jgi:hypothetical protein
MARVSEFTITLTLGRQPPRRTTSRLKASRCFARSKFWSEMVIACRVMRPSSSSSVEQLAKDRTHLRQSSASTV